MMRYLFGYVDSVAVGYLGDYVVADVVETDISYSGFFSGCFSALDSFFSPLQGCGCHPIHGFYFFFATTPVLPDSHALRDGLYEISNNSFTNAASDNLFYRI